MARNDLPAGGGTKCPLQLGVAVVRSATPTAF